jgi:hypothetical protein
VVSPGGATLHPAFPTYHVEGGLMLLWMDNARRYLWAFVELAFVALLAIILLHLLVGENSGGYVQSVIDNVMKLASGIPTPSLIGLAIVGLLVYMVAQRVK